MKQGKFGIRLAFYGILSFVLALFNQPLLCGLLLGFVLLAEGDRWAVRQVLQGFLLSLVVSFFSGISYLVGSAVSMPFRLLFGWYSDYDFVNTFQSVFSIIVYAGALVLSIMAILHLSRDQEANVPLLSNLAFHAFGERKPRPVKQQPFPQQPFQPPVYPPQPGQPAAPFQGQPAGGNPPTGAPPAYPYPAPFYQKPPYYDPNPTAPLPMELNQPQSPAPSAQPQEPPAQP